MQLINSEHKNELMKNRYISLSHVQTLQLPLQAKELTLE